MHDNNEEGRSQVRSMMTGNRKTSGVQAVLQVVWEQLQDRNMVSDIPR